MGMPSTKAECLRRIQGCLDTIASYQGFLAQQQAKLKSIKGADTQNFRGLYRHNIAEYKNLIAQKKAEIAKLKLHMKTLKT